ncbi:MAG TPA: FkbM family methyltransferase [Chitinophagales bacterium]|nr:FkbM family methyltransferase [Chitinophagales bacterium]HRP38816.1 FkbM family methyltransferase [Chitinophagales bacterium]
MNRIQLVRLFQTISNTNIFGTAKSMRYLSYLLLKKPTGKIVAETINGFSVWVDPAFDKSGLEHDIYFLGTYEKGTVSVMENFLQPIDNFIDVGANIGFVSLAAAKFCSQGKVFSFEANPDTFKILEENIRLNNFKNIQPYSMGLGSEKSVLKIFPNTLKNNRGGASMVQSDLNKDEVGVEVAIDKLDNVLDGNTTISMMKIDVEGFEMEVLKGATALLSSKNAPALIVECSESRNNLNFTPVELYRYLLGVNNYKIFKLELGKERLSKLVEVKGESDIPFHDNLFCFLPQQVNRLKKILK